MVISNTEFRKHKWHKLNLGDAMLADLELDRIVNLWKEEYPTSEMKDHPLYVRHESEGRLHCELCLYFHPSSYSLASKLDASTCSEPNDTGLSLLEIHSSGF